jgi:hypothetical protein
MNFRIVFEKILHGSSNGFQWLFWLSIAALFLHYHERVVLYHSLLDDFYQFLTY